MSAGQIGTIIILGLILIIIGAGVIAFIKVRNRVREFSKLAFGTQDILKGLKKVETESQVTPKSVSAGTSLYLPNIRRDFPDFHYDEMKRRAEALLTSYLRAIAEQNQDLLTEGTSELKDKVSLRIGMLRDSDQKEYYNNIKIHRTEIKTYRKEKGRCSIVFQSAIQYNYFKKRGEDIIDGAREKLTQSRYDVEMIYIQDRDLVENLEDAGIAMNCPNCGAPLPKLGAKKCAYCDSPVVEFSIRTWDFSDVEEV